MLAFESNSNLIKKIFGIIKKNRSYIIKSPRFLLILGSRNALRCTLAFIHCFHHWVALCYIEFCLSLPCPCFSSRCLLPLHQQEMCSASSTPHRRTSSATGALMSSSWAGESWRPPTSWAQPSRTGRRAGRLTPRDWARVTSRGVASQRKLS